MIVQYLGSGSFRLQSGDTSLLVNPGNNRFKADVVLRTLMLADEAPSPGEICYPGEYEEKGIEIQGWPLTEESTAKFIKTIYKINWEDIKFLFLGHISKFLPAAVLEEVGEVDLVFVPTGDDHFLVPEEAAKLVRRLEPKMIIPAYFKNASALAKILDGQSEQQEKLVFRSKDLGETKKARFVVLEGKS